MCDHLAPISQLYSEPSIRERFSNRSLDLGRFSARHNRLASQHEPGMAHQRTSISQLLALRDNRFTQRFGYLPH